MPWQLSKSRLHQLLGDALQLDMPYSQREATSPEKYTPASVLILIAWKKKFNTPELLVTKRTHQVETHKGQMAFPGGMEDPEDTSPLETALRETEEETGVSRELVDIVGTLPLLFIPPTGFSVTPVVGILSEDSENVSLRINPVELEEAFWVPVTELLNPKNFRLEPYPFSGRVWQLPTYHIGPHRIWGATASMIHNLMRRVELAAETSMG